MKKPCGNFKPTLKPTLNRPQYTLKQPWTNPTIMKPCHFDGPRGTPKGSHPSPPVGLWRVTDSIVGGWLTQGGLTLLGDWFRLVSPLHRHLRRYCQNDITDITMISFFRQSKTHSIRIGEAWKEAIPTYLSPSFNMPKGATSRSKKNFTEEP